MTLTEQLYEGTLPTGWYYFNNGVETYIVLYSNANTKDRKLQEPEGITVLCKVPTYEEIVKLKKDFYRAGVEIDELTIENTNLKQELEKDKYEKMGTL
jgi:hypothetical protein